MIYIKPNLKYVKSSSSYLTNFELNWTNWKLNVYYKEKNWHICLHRKNECSLCTALGSEDFGSDIV